MANLVLELNIKSAFGLSNVNLISKMDVYTVITIRGDENLRNFKEKTPIDLSGGSNPIWNHSVKISVDESSAREGNLTLVLKLISDRFIGNKEIGGVEIPLLELLNSYTPLNNGNSNSNVNGNGKGSGNGKKLVTYYVKTASGKLKGSLSFSYRFKTPAVISAPPPSPMIKYELTALPPPLIKYDLTDLKRTVSTTYPSLQHCYLPGSPAVYPWNRSVSPSLGYGYESPETAVKNKAAVGVGVGVGGGLFGGLMINGDFVNGVANSFDL